MSMTPLPAAGTPPTPGAAVAQRLQDQNQNLLTALVDEYRAMSVRLWRNPIAPAQEVFNEFNADGQSVIDIMNAIKDCIETIATACGQSLTDYLTTEETTMPDHTVDAGVITVT